MFGQLTSRTASAASRCARGKIAKAAVGGCAVMGFCGATEIHAASSDTLTTVGIAAVVGAVAGSVATYAMTQKCCESPPTTGKVEAKLKAMGVTIPEPATPKGSYISCVPAGAKQLHLCGHVPQTDPKTKAMIQGKVGKDLTVEQGAASARWCAINIIATLKQELGELDRVKRIVKVVGFVNCTDEFTQQPEVINGASNFLGEVFGDAGVHARSAVGTNALPRNIATEIECIVEIY